MKKLKDEKPGAKVGPDYFWAAPVGARARSSKAEAIVTTTTPGLQVAGTRVPKREGAALRELGRHAVSCRFIEKTPSPDGKASDPNRFRVILIQEGLGNTADGYYYTKAALKSAVKVFEGKKAYADHPSKFDEASRPERSVRDIVGHYEGVEYLEGEDGTGRLEADVVTLGGSQYDWVRALLTHAVEYGKTHKDQDFIGLSINASGDAEPMEAGEFLEKFEIVQSARAKVEQAVGDGLDEIKITNLIDSAISCDLVTQAGAKGKVLELLEAEMAKQKKLTENDEKKDPPKAADEEKPAPKKDGEGDGEHDDAAADVELIKGQLKKHGLVKEGEEADEATMKAAQHYQKAFQAAGHKGEEAASRACEAMKCAASAQESMKKEADDAEAKAKKEAEEAAAREAAAAPAPKKESSDPSAELAALRAENMKLRGENAKLSEKITATDVETHLDKVLRESNLPRAITKKFRESLKAPKSTKEVDEKFGLFMEGYRATEGGSGEGTAEGLDDCLINPEKSPGGADDKGDSSLEDCVEED